MNNMNNIGYTLYSVISTRRMSDCNCCIRQHHLEYTAEDQQQISGESETQSAPEATFEFDDRGSQINSASYWRQITQQLSFTVFTTLSLVFLQSKTDWLEPLSYSDRHRSIVDQKCAILKAVRCRVCLVECSGRLALRTERIQYQLTAAAATVAAAAAVDWRNRH